MSLEICENMLSRQTNGFSFDWKLKENFPFLEGHFPDRPLLPAVSLLDLCLTGIKAAYPNININISEIVNAKYMELIEPGHELEFTFINDDESKNLWSMKVTNKKTFKCIAIIKLILRN